jgi:hypothetical protein
MIKSAAVVFAQFPIAVTLCNRLEKIDGASFRL